MLLRLFLDTEGRLGPRGLSRRRPFALACGSHLTEDV